MMRKKIKYLLFIAAAAALLVVSVPLLLRIILSPDQVRELAESKLSLLTGRRCSVGSADFPIFRGLAVELNDLFIAEQPGYENPHFCRVEALYLKLKLIPLFFGRFEIERLTVVRPEIYLVRNEAGQLNTAYLFRRDSVRAAKDTSSEVAVAEKKEPSFSLVLHSMSVSGGTVRYIRQIDPQRFTITPVSLQVSFEREHRDSLLGITADAEIGGVESAAESYLADLCRRRPLKLSCIGGMNLSTRQLSFGLIQLEGAGLEIKGNAVLWPAEGYPYTARLRIMLSLGDLPALNGLSAEGRVDGELAFEGSLAELAELSSVGTLTGWEISLRGGRLPGRIKIPEMTMDFEGHDLKLRKMELAARSSELKIEGSLNNFHLLLNSTAKAQKVSPEWQARITGSALSLSDFLPAESLKPSPEERTGQPSGTARKKFPPGSGLVEVGRVVISDKLALETVKLRFRFSNDILTIDPLKAGLYSGNLHGKGRVRFTEGKLPRYDFDVEISRADAGETVTSLSSFGRYLSGKINSNLQFSGSGSNREQIMQSLTAHGSFSVVEGRLKGWPTLDKVARFTKIKELDPLVFLEWEGGLRIQEERVYTDSIAVETPQGRWNLTGSYGFDGSLDYSIQLILNEELSRKYLSQLPRNFASFLGNDQQRLALAFTVSGNADKPDIKWDVSPLVEKAAKKLERKLSRQLNKLTDRLFGRKTTSPAETPADSAEAADSSAKP